MINHFALICLYKLKKKKKKKVSVCLRFSTVELVFKSRNDVALLARETVYAHAFFGK